MRKIHPSPSPILKTLPSITVHALKLPAPSNRSQVRLAQFQEHGLDHFQLSQTEAGSQGLKLHGCLLRSSRATSTAPTPAWPLLSHELSRQGGDCGHRLFVVHSTVDFAPYSGPCHLQVVAFRVLRVLQGATPTIRAADWRRRCLADLPPLARDGQRWVIRFRGKAALIVLDPAIVELAFPYRVERFPPDALNYWRDLRVPGSQFGFPCITNHRGGQHIFRDGCPVPPRFLPSTGCRAWLLPGGLECGGASASGFQSDPRCVGSIRTDGHGS
jgi:hypothetical protein